MQHPAMIRYGTTVECPRGGPCAPVTSSLPAVCVTALLVLAASVYSVAARAEPEPTLPTRSLLGAQQSLVGDGWHITTPTPVRGYLGSYTIRTPRGEIVAEGRELLTLRIAELPAVARLDALGKGEVFATALAQGVRRTGESVVRVVTHPVETVAGIPAGIGRLLDRTARSVRRVAGAVGDAARRDGDAGAGATEPDTGERVEDFAREAAGLNRARREIARAAGLDPYTRNPLAAERLRSLAWAAVAGGVSVDLAVGAIGGVAGRVVGVSGRLDDLVWSAAPDSIRARLETVLGARGHTPEGMRAFFRNPWFTPTLQLAYVDALTALGTPAGEPAALEVAARAGSEVHARFLIQQLRMLRVHLAAGDSVYTLESLEASYAATTRTGRWLVTLPLDYLSWTDAVQARADDRSAMPAARKLVVAGTVSPEAARELARRGYAVVAGAGLPG
jgi:hypothetical protein